MARRRQRGEGSVFKRASDGKWVGRVEVGWVDGKRKRKTVYGSTQAEVVRKLRKVHQAVEAGNRATSSLTVKAWLTTWVEEVCPSKPKMKPRTLVNYRSIVNRYLVPCIGNVRLENLAPQHVRQVHAYVSARSSGWTVSNVHRALGTALNDAMREGLVTRNVVSLVHKPADPANDRGPLALEEVRRFFAVVEGDRLASRWHTAFLLGLRQGECLGLRWSHVDLEKGVADVAWQMQRVPYRHGCGTKQGASWPCGRRVDYCPDRALDVAPSFVYQRLEGQVCLQRPKTEKSTRVVPLPAPLVATLRHRHELYLAEREHYVHDHDLVWCRPDGGPVNVRTDRETWHAALAAAEIPRADQHSARHTTATLLLELGVAEGTIKRILGHSKVVTTRGYAHVNLGLQREAVSQIGAALWDQPPATGLPAGGGE